ncbi:MAG: hypothetical protein HYY93_14605 [Planctomycetes bacterium]|nr:hypothetical protein [Planctomycetota bacterium]
MGDVIRAFPVRSTKGERSRRLRLYFDTGSPYTFVKRSACAGMRDVFRLSRPADFGGLGNGHFEARDGMFMEVRLLGFWCRHYAYVVEDKELDLIYDVLVGHDFIQKFDISLRSRRGGKGVVLDRETLLMSQRVRAVSSPGDSDGPRSPGPGPRRRYRRPHLRSDTLTERSALACGKLTTDAICNNLMGTPPPAGS